MEKRIPARKKEVEEAIREMAEEMCRIHGTANAAIISRKLAADIDVVKGHLIALGYTKERPTYSASLFAKHDK